MMVNDIMAKDFLSLGLQPNDTILVHSSLSSLGYVKGGADTVIDTLLSVLTEGTLLMPALSYSTVRKETPLFSIKDTPSCVGTISETFRKREGVLRSMHPTHSVCAIGVHAKEILSQHRAADTPAGASSPFALLPKYNGKILMLGCKLFPNTSMHAVEELSKPWYLLKDEQVRFELQDYDGSITEKMYWCHNFPKVRQRYDRVAEIMEIRQGKVLSADCYLIDAAEMWRNAGAMLLKNEEYFIDRL